MSRLLIVAFLATASAYNCTKDGCVFSFTNRPSIIEPLRNGGRCGEVDAAPNMPNDIWADADAVKAYVVATEDFFGTANAPCDHNPYTWIQNGTEKIKWMNDRLDLAVCARECGCGAYGVKCKDVPDDPKNHKYCSLCGPSYNHDLTVQFWYPYKDPNLKNIVQLAQSVPDLSTLVTALVAGQLTTTLSSPGPFTVFAPTNEAFAKLPAATLSHLLDPKNRRELDGLLEYHVLTGAVFSKDLKTFQMVKTVEGKELKIVKTGSRVLVNDATVTKADNAANNGVVHIIDGVLIPPSGPTPAPGPVNHLWFLHVGSLEKAPFSPQCGEIDAAQFMPASLFDPANAAELELYKAVTIKEWGESLELGRCANLGFTVAHGTARADWDGEIDLTKICERYCHCDYHIGGCHNQTTDDPKHGTFCTLCGDKDAGRIGTVSLFLKPNTKVV
jgi:uncharacterized surface protein with fasciclin (FAS1) repeats